MRGLRLHGAGDVRAETLPDPVLPPGGVLVDVEAAGVCAADRALLSGHHPWGELAYPFTPGHELLGRVRATDRADFPVGTRVTAEVMLPDGTCPACRRGRTNLCRGGAHLGSAQVPGAFAEQVALPATALVHAVPDSLPVEAAVLAEPAACALHAVRRGGVGPGDRVAVVGVGPVGALVVLAARREGASHVGVVCREGPAGDARRAQARRLLHAGPPEPEPDVVLECSGDPAAVDAALALAAPGGRVVLYGVYTEPSEVRADRVAELGELDVRGGHLAPGAFPDAVAALQEVPAGLVTALRPLADAATALGPAPRAAHEPRLKEVLVP